MIILINKEIDINHLIIIEKYSFLKDLKMITIPDLLGLNLSFFEINMLIRCNVLIVLANSFILPTEPIYYLNDQLKINDKNFKLDFLESNSKIFWFGLPFFSPNELMYSATLGCINILKELKNKEMSILGLFPFFSSSSLCNDFIYKSFNALNAIDKKMGIIGGDHKVTWVFLKQIAKIFPEKEIIYFHIDAHTDLYDYKSFDPEKINHANFLIDLIVNNIVSKAFLLGCRDSIDNFNIIKNEEYNIHGIYQSFNEIPASTLIFNNSNSHLHLSIDIDVLDPYFAPSVSNPIEMGWSLSKLKNTVQNLMNNIQFDSFSVVEACNGDLTTINSTIEIIQLLTMNIENKKI